MARAGDVFKVFDNTITIMVSRHDSNGALTMFIDEAPPNTGPPMHVHKDIGETAYVLQGTYKVNVGGELRELGQGEAAFLPANVPHTYKNISDGAGRVLFTVLPGGLDDFFEEISKRSDLHPPEDLPAINEIAAKYQMEIVGPPLD